MEPFSKYTNSTNCGLIKESATRQYTLFPEDREELKIMIEDEIKKHGDSADLNHIDISKIDDFSNLFIYSNFNGDISGWDVSHVKDMSQMFYSSNFNGDIS